MTLSVPHPFFCSLCLLAAVFFDSAGILRCSIVAALLHECAHAVAYRCLLRKKPSLQLHVGGLALQWEQDMADVRTQAAVILAGPLANFFATGLFGGIVQYRAGYFQLFFAGVNLLMGLFNLLPMGFLDGGRLLELLLFRILPFSAADMVCTIVQWACLLALCLAFLVFDTDIVTQLTLICFISYFCLKSFCIKN